MRASAKRLAWISASILTIPRTTIPNMSNRWRDVSENSSTLVIDIEIETRATTVGRGTQAEHPYRLSGTRLVCNPEML